MELHEWIAEEIKHFERCLEHAEKYEKLCGSSVDTLKTYWQGGLDLVSALQAKMELGEVNEPNQMELGLQVDNAHNAGWKQACDVLRDFVQRELKSIDNARKVNVKIADSTANHWLGQEHAFNLLIQAMDNPQDHLDMDLVVVRSGGQ